MKWRLAILVLFGALSLTSCAKHATWHQKMVLYFQTPDGPREVSVVQEVEFVGPTPGAKQIFRAHSQVRGEAAVASFDGRYLFALLGGADGVLYYSLRSAQPDIGPYVDELRRITQQTDPLDVPRNLYPRLATFTDITDPASVALVDPDNLAASFGPGYALKRITVAITNEPVTEGVVEDVLGGLEAVGRERANLKGRPAEGLVSDQPNPEIYMIAPSDFSTELYK